MNTVSESNDQVNRGNRVAQLNINQQIRVYHQFGLHHLTFDQEKSKPNLLGDFGLDNFACRIVVIDFATKIKNVRWGVTFEKTFQIRIRIEGLR